MHTRLGSLLGFVGLVACGGGGHATSDANASDALGSAADSAVDAPPLHDVTISTFGDPPNLYEYRDGSGAWQPVSAPNSQGESTIHVTNDFVVLALCAGEGSAFVAVSVAATLADGNQFIDCFAPTANGSAPPTFDVTGTMNQAGTLQLGEPATGTTSPWTFDVKLPTGTYDAAGFDTAHTQMLLRRNLAVNGAALAVTPALDLTAEGSALGSAAFTVAGIGSDATVSSDTTLFTANAFVEVGSAGGASAVLAPVSLLAADDFSELQVAAETATTAQFADVTSQGAVALAVPATFDMIPALDAVTFTDETGTVRAHWTTLPTLPASAEVQVTVENATQEQIAISSPAWLALHAATDLAFDTTATGYKFIWDISTTQAFFAELAVTNTDDTTGVQYQSAFADPASALRARRRTRGHAGHGLSGVGGAPTASIIGNAGGRIAGARGAGAPR